MSTTPTGAAKQWRDFLLVLLAGAMLATAGVAGYALTPTSDTPASDSAEAGFARDMITHHAQAVRMAIDLRDRTSDPTLRSIAIDIITGQTAQMGAMQGWLASWHLNQTATDRPAMAWMRDDSSSMHGHGGGDMAPVPDISPTAGPAGTDDPGMMQLLPDGRMPGMATQSQLDELERLTGRPAEILFLQLMIKHHQGGIAMANAALRLVNLDYEKSLARSIANSQTAEIVALQELLTARGVTS